MTIDEAIEKEKFKARVDRIKANKRIFHNNDEHEISACNRSAEYHEQLAEWLEELKKYKEKPEGYLWDEAVQQGYNKAIDDFVKSFKNLIEDELLNPILMSECKKLGVWKNYDFEKMAEQLKAGAGIGTDNQ